MKTKLFWLLTLIAIPMMMVSCYQGASDQELKNYVNALLPYYPYTIEDEFVFVNESTGERWEARPYDYYRDGQFPYTHTWSCHESMASCFGDWSAEVEAILSADSLTRRMYGTGQICTHIAYCGGGPMVDWHIKLIRSSGDYIDGGSRTDCTKDEILTLLTDTILLPIAYHDTTNTIISAEGAYARIVRGEGLTDFSADGKTIWRRVKK